MGKFDPIRRLIKARGMNIATLAERSQVSRTHIQKLLREEGKTPSPTRRTLERIASALRVDVSELTSPEAVERLTLYDTDPRIRNLVDRLALLPDDDRSRWLTALSWMIPTKTDTPE